MIPKEFEETYSELSSKLRTSSKLLTSYRNTESELVTAENPESEVNRLRKHALLNLPVIYSDLYAKHELLDASQKENFEEILKAENPRLTNEELMLKENIDALNNDVTLLASEMDSVSRKLYKGFSATQNSLKRTAKFFDEIHGIEKKLKELEAKDPGPEIQSTYQSEKLIKSQTTELENLTHSRETLLIKLSDLEYQNEELKVEEKELKAQLEAAQKKRDYTTNISKTMDPKLVLLNKFYEEGSDTLLRINGIKHLCVTPENQLVVKLDTKSDQDLTLGLFYNDSKTDFSIKEVKVYTDMAWDSQKKPDLKHSQLQAEFTKALQSRLNLNRSEPQIISQSRLILQELTRK